MTSWKFGETVNASHEYKDDVISNEDVLRMFNYCREQRQAAKINVDRIRWYREKSPYVSVGKWDLGLVNTAILSLVKLRKMAESPSKTASITVHER